jgi:tetratricopeptide (TPR) repeat protein
MKYLLGVCILSLVVAPLGAAEGATLQEARQRWLRGNYEEARSLYENLARDAKTRVAATIGLSRCLDSKGEYDPALATIEAALKDLPKEADLHARRAELLYARGRWEDAEKAAAEALKRNKDHFLARWVRAEVYRDRGDLKKADTECRWFVRVYTDRSNNDMDIKDPDDLLLVGLAGTENARWHNLADQFDFIINDVYADALKADKDFWPAHYQAGMLLLEKYNKPQALEAFDKALAINPSAAEVLVGKGMLALQELEYEKAESFAEQALKVNVNLPDALRLSADVRLAGGNVNGALKDLNQARTIDPRDESTLGRVGACFHVQHKQAEEDALLKEVEAHDPKPGLYWAELGERLDERRHFDDAEACYQKAADLRPTVPGPRTSLGMLYMRMGRETEARALLQKAFEADPFNVRVLNMLRVLKHLDNYATLKTEHFVIRYDPANDKVLAQYMAEYLEKVYADLSAKFQYRPKDAILIEVFNNHEKFSGRVIALPDLHTIGACTGRMFAMVSPNGKDIRKPFNWGRVLRHELTHIFNLAQSKFQVTHWFTEGLAVINEDYPRPQQWNELLLERVPKGELMNLDDIDLGFIRPRSPQDWHMAYCQSQMYVEYLKSKYGAETVGDMLNAYRDGLDTTAALAKVCKVDKADFEKGYRTYVDEVVKALKGKPVEKPLTYAELQEAHEKEPGNLDLTARLAEQLLRRDKAKAFKLADEVLGKKPDHGLANYVKAKLVLQSGDVDKARSLLEAGLDRASPEPKVLEALGKLYYDAGDFAKAEAAFELGHKAAPQESQWLLDLARVYAQTGDKEKQIAVLKELVPTDADDLDHRKRLARMLLDAGRPAEAERYAREALEIDIRDKEVQEALEKALTEQHKDAEAEHLRKLLSSDK